MSDDTDAINFKERRIEAFYVPLIYKDDDDQDPREGIPIKFDATEQILALPYDKIVDIVCQTGFTHYDLIDSVVPCHMRNGSYKVTALEDSIMQFFGFDDEKQSEDFIHDAALDQARNAFRIGEVKTYRVRIVQTREAWIETDACSAEDASNEALSYVKENPDLFDASSIDPSKTRYSNHEAKAAEDTQNVDRPKMRK